MTMSSKIQYVAQNYFQLSDTSVLGEVLGQIVAFIPRLIGALLVLLVGWIVGKLLGRLVTAGIERIDLGRVLPGGKAPVPGSDTSAEEPEQEASSTFGGAVGTLITYYVYYLTVVAAADILQIQIVTRLLGQIGEYLPVLFGAGIVLIVGLIAGRLLEEITVELISGLGIDEAVRDTPLERVAGDRPVGWVIGRLVALYIYVIALLAAADTLDIGVLSSMLSTLTQYLPQLVGGVLVLAVGIWLGNWLGELIATREFSLSRGASVAVKGFVYYLVVTIALQTAGFNASILSTLLIIVTTAVAGAVALAFIIAVGVGGALGSKEYIAENIDGWMSTAHQSLTGE